MTLDDVLEAAPSPLGIAATLSDPLAAVLSEPSPLMDADDDVPDPAPIEMKAVRKNAVHGHEIKNWRVYPLTFIEMIESIDCHHWPNGKMTKSAQYKWRRGRMASQIRAVTDDGDELTLTHGDFGALDYRTGHGLNMSLVQSGTEFFGPLTTEPSRNATLDDKGNPVARKAEENDGLSNP